MNQEMNCENTEMEQQTELFDFDSDDNRTSAKTPALKAIGGGIKDKMEKYWCWFMDAHENAEICSMEKRLHRFIDDIHVWIIKRYGHMHW